MKNEIIKVEQLPVITERLHEIKAAITEKVDYAMTLVCTPETVAAVKKTRADLNKDFKDFEERRKEVKNAVMLPYNQFEAVYKECITDVFKNADIDLKNKIDSVENELKVQKAEEVYIYFNEYRDSKNKELRTFLSYSHAGINVTLSASLKSLKEQAKAFIDRVCDDLNLIETQEHKEEILYEYKQSLNVSAAITAVVNRYKAIEEAKAREAERQAIAEAVEKSVETVEKVAEALAPPKVEEPILTVSFKVKGTRAQLKALKEFLNNGGYEYE